MILAHAEAEWEDKTVFVGWVLDVVGRTVCRCEGMSPSNSLPILNIDGNTLTSTVACANYLSYKYDLHHDDPKEAWKIDSVLDLCSEYINSYIAKVAQKQAAEGEAWWNANKAVKLGAL